MMHAGPPGVGSRLAGVTIIELMIVVVIVGVLAALVGPSFKQVIDMQRLRGVHGQIVTDLQFARSEALLRRIPVHVKVQPQTAGTGACYIIFQDLNRVYPFSAACDCTLAAGARCTSAQTAEIRTVQLDRAVGIDLAGPVTTRHGFDPESGALFLRVGDTEDETFISRFAVDSFLDAQRKFRAHVEYSGKVTTCAPPGSTIGATACPP